MSFDPYRARQAAFTLALIAALVGLTYYPGYSVGSGVLQLPWGFVKFLSDTLVVATQVLGTIGAVILISVVTGTAPRERAAVWMLALAAAAPLVQALLGYGDLYLYPSALVYPAALILIVGALALRRRGDVSSRARRPRRGAVAAAGVLVATLGIGAVALATAGWAGRTPLITMEPAGSPLYEDWMRLKLGFEQLVDTVLIASAIGVIAIVVGVVLIGVLRTPIGLGSTTTAAVVLIVFGYAQLLQFLVLGTPTAGWVDGPGVLVTLVRVSIVAAVFATVDRAQPHPMRA